VYSLLDRWIPLTEEWKREDWKPEEEESIV
jgi:hypothetical protein